MPANIHFRKNAFKGCNRDETLFLPVILANRDLSRQVVEKFEAAIRSRGETVLGVLEGLRLRGFVLSRAGLLRYKRGDFDTFSGLTFNVLAQYCGYRNFIELIQDESIIIPEKK